MSLYVYKVNQIMYAYIIWEGIFCKSSKTKKKKKEYTLENNRRESKKLKQSTCSKIKIRRKGENKIIIWKQGGWGKTERKEESLHIKISQKKLRKKSAFLKNLPEKLNLSNINNAKFQSQDSPPLLQQEQKQGHEHGGGALRGTSSS